MDFGTWLVNTYRQKDGTFKDNRFGDLAKDVYCDSRFQVTEDQKTVEDYLESRYACTDCMDAFHAVWRRYAREVLSDA